MGLGWIIVGPILAMFVLAIVMKIEDFFFKRRLEARKKQKRREMVMRITEGKTKEEIDEMIAGMQGVIESVSRLSAEDRARLLQKWQNEEGDRQ